MARIDVRKAAERDREIASPDQHEIDARRIGDGCRIAHAAHGLDHHTDHGAA